MVSGERLVLSTLLAGIYLPGIEEIYLRSRQCPEGPGIRDKAREESLKYSLSPLECINNPHFCCGAGIELGQILVRDTKEGDFSSLEAKDSLALYGGGRRLLDLLRERPPSLTEAPDLLRRHGFASEASRLERIGLLDLARQFILERAVLTPFHPEAEWIWNQSISLPFALWCSAPDLESGGTEFPRRLFAVVGSRQIDSKGEQGAASAALALQQGGWTLITGGAQGVDSVALDAVASTMTPRGVVLHPHGLSTAAGQKLRRRWPWAWHLSLCPPWQEFEGRWAHQRNRIIFALSEGAVSIGPRCRVGGTWSGALECLRSRLAPLAVLADTGELAALTTLKNLGAFEVSLDDLNSSRGPAIIDQIVREGLRRKQGWAGLGSSGFESGQGSGQGSLFGAELPARIASYGDQKRTADPDRVKEDRLAYGLAPSGVSTAA